MTPRVREILDWYRPENIGVLTNLARLFRAGSLGGSGRLCLLSPPDLLKSNPEQVHAVNRNSYDPSFRLELAAGLSVSALSASRSEIKALMSSSPGEVLTFLEVNQVGNVPNSRIINSVEEALSLGCIGVKINLSLNEIESHFTWLCEQVKEASRLGLIALVSGVSLDESYESQSFFDSISQYAKLATESGAHIINVCLPANKFKQKTQEKLFLSHRIKLQKAFQRVRHLLDVANNGQRIILLSLDESQDAEELILQGKEIARGGGFGTIVSSSLWYKYSKDCLLYTSPSPRDS